MAGGQDEYVPNVEHTVGLAGRFELDFQLALKNQDQVNLVRSEPVLVDGLGQLAHPDHFDALPGEHGPDIAERGGPDLMGLAERDVENFRGRTKGSQRTADEGEEPGWANGKPEESPDGKPEDVR